VTRTPREIAAWSIGLLVVLLYAMIPVMWILSLSLKPATELGDKRFIPKDFSLDNYDTIFSTSEFKHALVNSIGIAGIATLISIVLAAMAAYALSRLDFAGKTVILSARSPWRCSRPSRSSVRCSTSGATSASTTPGPG